MARPSCLMLLEHFMRLAASRIFCTAGSSSPISTAMMAITTSSSISVNAERGRDMAAVLQDHGKARGIAKLKPENLFIGELFFLGIEQGQDASIPVVRLGSIRSFPEAHSLGPLIWFQW